MKRLQIFAAVCVLGCLQPAMAGLYTDDLSRCLVENTTPQDKTALVQWIFVAMSQHPSVIEFTRITDADVEKANEVAGELFMRLVTDTCAEKTKKAVKYEGPASIQLSFQVLGQAAAGDLFSSPNVVKVMSGLEKYLDAKKLEALAQ